jgi:radical SAM protein with 4Fe4S-binding SPASM domain
MSSETLDMAIEAIRTMVDRQRAPGAMVIWHGGEPLALPKEYFRQACERVRERMPDAIQSIQTSLVPYNSAWADLIRDFMDGHIGSSIDFSQRKIRGDVNRYHDMWLEKVSLARADGFTVTPGVVPSRGELGRGQEINLWMIEHGFNHWNIDRYNSFGWEDKNRPTNAEHSTFLTEVFDSVMQQFRQGCLVKVNTVQAALAGVVLNAAGDRWGGSCSRDFIVVNPDGSTSACPDKISFEDFGNISGGYDAFSKSEARKKWIREHISGHRNEHCATCQFNSFCRSGCPLTPNAPASEGECSGYHRHLSHVADFASEFPEIAKSYLDRTAQ